MPQSLGQVYIHLILSTTKRFPYLADKDLRQRLCGYMAGICRNLGCQSLWIDGGEEHLHLLLRLPRIQSIAQIIYEVLKNSTMWLHDGGLTSFAWSADYGAFSVSPENVGKAMRYIKNQEEYHREATFDDEYSAILGKCDGLEHKVDIHLIFSTKNRVPFLADKTLRQHLHDRLAEICRPMDCPSLQIGGIEDHVHILYRLSPDRQLAQVTQKLKTSTTAWLAAQHRIHDFGWQDGYAAFSVSPQHIPAVIRYIENQEEHHRQETSEAEYRRFHRSPTQLETPIPPTSTARCEPRRTPGRRT